MLDSTRKFPLMVLYIILYSFSIIGCKQSLTGEAQLANEIFQSVELPDGARNPGEYSRYHARGPNGVVDAIYIVQAENHREEVKKVCSEVGREEYPCDQADFGVVDPGESKWVDDVKDLPARNGGGCSYIHIKYDPDSRNFLTVECNGPY